jgi:hypothetical protein
VISHRHKCIFVHLRRTGGNSIEHALGGIQLLDRDGRETTTWEEAIHAGRSRFKLDNRGHYLHDGVLKIREAFPLEFPVYFKFSMVRNPWAQMLSMFFKRKGKDGTSAEFAAFIESYALFEGTTARHTLYDEHGQCLVDFIGRFENFVPDFNVACERAGIKDVRLPHLNATQNQDYQSFYDLATKRRVEEIYGEDIERHGYRF